MLRRGCARGLERGRADALEHILGVVVRENLSNRVLAGIRERQDLGDARDAALGAESLELHDDVDRRGDLRAQEAQRISSPENSASVSSRRSDSTGEFACTVDIDPPWPVFIA